VAEGESSKRARPISTPDTADYWANVAEGRLVMQRCRQCHLAYFYPRSFCPSCLSADVPWEAMSGRARLYSYVICHRPAPGFEDEVPYILALVDLEEGPRMMTNIVGVPADPSALELDMELTVTFEKRRDGVLLPQFRPAS
jgi:uncharacterized OB-fold protein